MSSTRVPARFAEDAADFCRCHRITRAETIDDLARLLYDTARRETEARVCGVATDLREMADRVEGHNDDD